MCWWVKQPPDGRHDGRLLWLSCRESAVREETPGTANLADAKGFAPKNGWGPRQNSPVSKQFLSCKLAVTGPRMCSHTRLTELQFSSAAHQKCLYLSCFSTIYSPFSVSFLVNTAMRRLWRYFYTILSSQNDAVAIPNDPLLLPPSALPKIAIRYNVSDYIIQTGTRNLHVRSLTSFFDRSEGILFLAWSLFEYIGWRATGDCYRSNFYNVSCAASMTDTGVVTSWSYSSIDHAAPTLSTSSLRLKDDYSQSNENANSPSSSFLQTAPYSNSTMLMCISPISPHHGGW